MILSSTLKTLTEKNMNNIVSNQSPSVETESTLVSAFETADRLERLGEKIRERRNDARFEKIEKELKELQSKLDVLEKCIEAPLRHAMNKPKVSNKHDTIPQTDQTTLIKSKL